jgi:chromosomal replication initiator protein
MRSYFESEIGNCAMNLNEMAKLAKTINKIKGSFTYSFDYILESVCEYFNLTLKQITRKTRKREICVPRQIVCYFARDKTALPLNEIGFNLNIDHSTVLHAARLIKDFKDTGQCFDVEIINSKYFRN